MSEWRKTYSTKWPKILQIGIKQFFYCEIYPIMKTQWTFFKIKFWTKTFVGFAIDLFVNKDFHRFSVDGVNNHSLTLPSSRILYWRVSELGLNQG